jgi:hypothetical protein
MAVTDLAVGQPLAGCALVCRLHRCLYLPFSNLLVLSPGRRGLQRRYCESLEHIRAGAKHHELTGDFADGQEGICPFVGLE